MMETTRFNTPASFSLNQYGTQLANAASNSQMQIISPASTTMSSLSLGGDSDDFGGSFVETEIKQALIDDPKTFLA